jgi:hypothetical protein
MDYYFEYSWLSSKVEQDRGHIYGMVYGEVLFSAFSAPYQPAPKAFQGGPTQLC